MLKKPAIALLALVAFCSQAQAAPTTAPTTQPLDETLLVGRFSQCSYNAISSVMIHYFGPLGDTPDKKAFEQATFYGPIKKAGYEPYFGWGPFTKFMVESGLMTWNGHPVVGIKGEHFSLRPKADTSFDPKKGFTVTYVAGEREILRKKLLTELSKGPVILWTPYAAGKTGKWQHVKHLDENTDLVEPAFNTHSVALFKQPGDQVLVVDGSARHGVFITDPDTIVSTSAAMTALVRGEDRKGSSILKRGLKNIHNDEYNIAYFKAADAPTTAPATQSASLQDEALDAADPAYHTALQSAFTRAGDRADTWASAICRSAGPTRADLVFLVATMPQRDLVTIDPSYIIENVNLAEKSRTEFAWGSHISDELYRSSVLPYVNLNEKRERWRADFAEKASAIVADCKTSGEAALALNKNIFPLLHVKYHPTKRPKPDQSPSESIEAGYASCSGLSIILVDACRAVGVPARVVGTPLWFTGKGDENGNHAGNHTWVEVWDGQWHVLGAIEVTKLDDTWFVNNAAMQSKAPAEQKFRIYATSLNTADTYFPMVWAENEKYVSAVDVTATYANRKKVTISVDASHLTLRQSGQLIADLDVADNTVALVLNPGQMYDATIVKDGASVAKKLTIPADVSSPISLTQTE